MKWKNFICVVLTIAMLSGTIYCLADTDNFIFSFKNANLIVSDNKLAEHLSGMTGVSSKEVLQLRSETGSWNSAMERVKNGEKPSAFMTEDELTEKLAQENYSEQEIKEASEAVLQINYYLSEICKQEQQNNGGLTSQSLMDEIFENKSDLDEIEDYLDIFQKIDTNLLIYFCVKLKNEFGSFDLVIDEYLYCLQTEVDFNLYITDRNKYDKAIMEKGSTIPRESAVTVQKIFDFMIQSYNRRNDAIKKSQDIGNNPTVVGQPGGRKIGITGVLPQVENPKPQDPTAQVMDEIDRIIYGSLK